MISLATYNLVTNNISANALVQQNSFIVNFKEAWTFFLFWLKFVICF